MNKYEEAKVRAALALTEQASIRLMEALIQPENEVIADFERELERILAIPEKDKGKQQRDGIEFHMKIDRFSREVKSGTVVITDEDKERLVVVVERLLGVFELVEPEGEPVASNT